MRDISDLTNMVIKHTPRRSARQLFGEEEAQQFLLANEGPVVDQSLGMDDLDPAFPDYNVANLFNAYFRDSDPEDDTIDYWTIDDGDYPISVIDDASAPGGVCIEYAPTGETTTASSLISAAVPIGPGLDIGVVLVAGNQTSSVVRCQAKIRWYDEEQNLIATTVGQRKALTRKVTRWLKIPRSAGAQAASFASLVLEFSASGSGTIRIFGAGLYPLAPSLNSGSEGPDTVEDQTPSVPSGLYLYDDFDRSDDATLGLLPLGATNGAPWEGGTEWEDKETALGVADDGQLELLSNAAHAESASGSLFLSSFQRGTNWLRQSIDGPVVVGKSEGITLDIYSEGTGFYTLPLPDGCDVVGRWLICFITAPTAEGPADLDYTMTTRPAEPWTNMLGTGPFYYKEIVTPYDPTDATESLEVVDVGSSQPVVNAVVLLVEGLFDTLGALTVASATDATTADPPNVADPGWSNVDNLLAITAISANAEITAGPEGYEEVGTAEAVGGYKTTYVRMDQLITPVGSDVDPGTYTTDDDMSGDDSTVWTVLVQGGTITDPNGGYVVDIEYPEGPHNRPHIALVKFRVTDSDNGAYFTYTWTGCPEEGNDKSGGAKVAYISSGTFINVAGASQTEITDLVEGDWYWMLIDLTGTLQRVKVWPVTGAMPAAWDQTGAFTGGNTEPFSYLAIDVEIVAGTGFDIDEIWIGYPVEEGQSGRAYIGAADGTSVEYTSPVQWGAGGPKVYVDGFLTPLVSFDASDWSMMFDRAPSYGARIEVEI